MVPCTHASTQRSKVAATAACDQTTAPTETPTQPRARSQRSQVTGAATHEVRAAAASRCEARAAGMRALRGQGREVAGAAAHVRQAVRVVQAVRAVRCAERGEVAGAAARVVRVCVRVRAATAAAVCGKGGKVARAGAAA